MKKPWFCLPFTLLFIILMLCPASAQRIKILIDGREINFDQPPAMINGTVMVPMRGVFEELGAEVKWNSAKQTIAATKAATEIIIQIGSTIASVDGKAQQLATPATMVGGRTLVPLRFISEALGADVKWRSTTRTVLISSTNAPSSATPAPQASASPAPMASVPPASQAPSEVPKITQVSHNATGALQPGNVITVSLLGDPGCKATFDIPGISVNIPMTETSQGVYSGSFRIPDTAWNVQNASIFGRLSRNSHESVRQAETRIGMVTNSVRITRVLPAENSVVKTQRPNILIVLHSSGGARLNNSSVILMVNNQRTNQNPVMNNDLVSYEMPYNLPQGQNSIAFSASDTSGNPLRKTWYFTVSTQGRVQSITHNATVPLGRGEVLQVSLQGDTGGRATFDIGPYRRNNGMAEKSPGVYAGSYRIQPGDSFQNAQVTGYLTMPGQSALAVTATTPVSVKKQLFLRFTSPASGSTVNKQFYVAGVTSPFAKVSLEVRISLGGVLGAAAGDTSILKSEIQANEAGNFSYQINDRFPVNGGVYTITGLAHDAQGQSTTITLKVNRR